MIGYALLSLALDFALDFLTATSGSLVSQALFSPFSSPFLCEKYKLTKTDSCTQSPKLSASSASTIYLYKQAWQSENITAL